EAEAAVAFVDAETEQAEAAGLLVHRPWHLAGLVPGLGVGLDYLLDETGDRVAEGAPLVVVEGISHGLPPAHRARSRTARPAARSADVAGITVEGREHAGIAGDRQAQDGPGGAGVPRARQGLGALHFI